MSVSFNLLKIDFVVIIPQQASILARSFRSLNIVSHPVATARMISTTDIIHKININDPLVHEKVEAKVIIPKISKEKTKT